MRDYAASLAQLEPLVEAAPQFPLARQHLARALIAGKNPGRALSLVDGLPVAGPNAHSIRGCALAALGRRDEAHAEIRTLEDTSARGFGVALDITMIHAALGNADAALTTLERAARDPWQQLGFLKSEPGLDSIRNDPRFRAVSRQVGLG